MSTTIKTRKRSRLSSDTTAEQNLTTKETKTSRSTFRHPYLPNIGINATWSQDGVIVAGGNDPGSANNQLHYPWSICVDDDDQTIYVAEYSNHRITKWMRSGTNGQIVAGGHKQGYKANQLNSPANVIIDKANDSLIICDYSNQRVMRWSCHNGKHGETIISDINCWGLAMDNYGYIYVSDFKKHEVKRWKPGETTGTVVAGGNDNGNHVNQLHCPSYICVDQDSSIYISDVGNHRVMKWSKGAKEGIIIAGGEGEGKSLRQISYPSGIAIDQLGSVYIVDSHNHRVMRWLKGATQGSIIIGRNEQESEKNQLNGPVGLSFDQQGNIYIADNLNHRVLKFNINSTLTS